MFLVSLLLVTLLATTKLSHCFLNKKYGRKKDRVLAAITALTVILVTLTFLYNTVHLSY